MTNEKIRNAAKEAKIPLWMIAERAFNGMADFAFSRKLRHQLAPDEEAHVLAVIEEMKEEAAKNG